MSTAVFSSRAARPPSQGCLRTPGPSPPSTSASATNRTASTSFSTARRSVGRRCRQRSFRTGSSTFAARRRHISKRVRAPCWCIATGSLGLPRSATCSPRRASGEFPLPPPLGGTSRMTSESGETPSRSAASYAPFSPRWSSLATPTARLCYLVSSSAQGRREAPHGGASEALPTYSTTLSSRRDTRDTANTLCSSSSDRCAMAIARLARRRSRHRPSSLGSPRARHRPSRCSTSARRMVRGQGEPRARS
mmetsp:Transcript_22448/g.66140  ORF Transcript_22448/g.66140 Transcript_22448/m.66140 type:complete len:250 (-) Transcript_22448:103-852(-)